MKHKASALLLSFFMMTMLILVSVGVSFLLIRDVDTVRTIVGGTQATYAAEGASELGLQIVKDSLPGYEPELEFLFANATLASLDVNARGPVVPCSADGLEWGVLGPNESVQLALFAQQDAFGNDLEKLENFYVEFYVGDGDGLGVPLSGDVLRWKILGTKDGGTEAISEFIPMESTKRSPENPSIFGSAIPADRAVPTGYTHAKYYQKIGKNFVFNPAYPIKQFLTGHNLNYLILTNVAQATGREFIYFRLKSLDVDPVCNYVSLDTSADQEFGSARQSLDTLVKEGENLPVFDFVLYNTDGVKKPALAPFVIPDLEAFDVNRLFQ